MAVEAPIPMAMVRIAVMANAGFLRKPREAWIRSRMNIGVRHVRGTFHTVARATNSVDFGMASDRLWDGQSDREKVGQRVRIQAESASEAGQLCSEFLSAFSQKNTIWAADKRQ